MSKKTWPESVDQHISLDDLRAVDQTPRTACKHGLGSCEQCGTTNLRDRIHTTQKGKGEIAFLREKK